MLLMNQTFVEKITDQMFPPKSRVVACNPVKDLIKKVGYEGRGLSQEFASSAPNKKFVRKKVNYIEYRPYSIQ